MKFTPSLFLLPLLALVCGCSWTLSGQEFDDTKVAEIQVGKTTERQLLALFGEPISRSMDKNGVLQLEWYRHYVPAFGGPEGGYKKRLKVTLDNTGRVTAFKSGDN